jgi:hypothetical protein
LLAAILRGFALQCWRVRRAASRSTTLRSIWSWMNVVDEFCG